MNYFISSHLYFLIQRWLLLTDQKSRPFRYVLVLSSPSAQSVQVCDLGHATWYDESKVKSNIWCNK